MSEYTGIYKGSVTDNNDPEKRYRILATIPAVLADQSSGWCEPLFSATKTTLLVGEIVWVLFINGDLTRPIYISAASGGTEIQTLMAFMGFTQSITADTHYLF